MKSIIIGGGKYGEVYLYYLQEAGYDIVGFLDDNQALWNKKIQDVPVLGGIETLEFLKDKMDVEAVFCPLGNNKLRVEFLSKAQELDYKTPNYIHPSVHLPTNIKLGNGVYILLGTNIMPNVILEDYVMISMGANIAHHSTLKRGTFISTGVNFGASIVADDNAYVGISATVMTGINKIGKDCLVGAGAVVIKDVPDKAIVAGVPAKILKYKQYE